MYNSIIDIKIGKIAGNQIVLAITDSSLLQFHSNKNVNLKSTFNEYIHNPSLLKDHTIMLDAYGDSKNTRDSAIPNLSTQINTDDTRVQTMRDDVSSNDDITYNQLKLFLTQSSSSSAAGGSQSMLYGGGSQGDEDNMTVGGFGWMNEYGFFYAGYNPNEYIIKQKSL